MTTRTRTTPRAALYGDLFADTVLDDLDTDAAILADAWRAADAAIGRAAREERRSRAIKARFEDKRRFRADLQDVVANSRVTR